MFNKTIDGLTFSSATNNNLISEVLNKAENCEVLTYNLSLKFKDVARPQKYVLSIVEPMINAYGYWSANAGQNSKIGAEWAPSTQVSRTAEGFPLISVYDKSNINVSTVYISDAFNACKLLVGVVEEDISLKFSVELFTEISPEISEYNLTLKVDKRKIPFYDVVKSAREWFSEIGFPPAYVPNIATYPLYSFWYSYHQKVYQSDVLKECENAKKFGFKSVIIDDGWQTEDNSGGYAYCGDWQIAKSKINDMKGLVDSVHNLGLKFIIWYSVPFVGFKSENYERFKGKYLYSIERLSASVLDPRFKDVRSFLVEVYCNAVKTYGYDGLKLDFIDRFKLAENSPTNYEDMDCASVEEGVRRLLSEVSLALKKINPEIIIEFRQKYIGPVISAYGNIFRVADCPGDAISNKKCGLDLRLTSSATAVHSDMIKWNYLESNEGVLNQLYSALFTVPQISVKLNEISVEHGKILKAFLEFWNSCREIIIDGNLQVKGAENGYTLASCVLGNDKLTAVYSEQTINIDKNNEYVVNATGLNCLYFDLNSNYSYVVINYFGNVVSSGKAKKGLLKLPINNGYIVKFNVE